MLKIHVTSENRIISPFPDLSNRMYVTKYPVSHFRQNRSIKMTNLQIRGAIEQVKVHCDLLMENYESVSMRGALYTLGFTTEEADEVIRYCSERGFKYCLDPMIAATHFDPNNPRAVNNMITDRPSAQACYWGPDQLKSRLQSLRS